MKQIDHLKEEIKKTEIILAESQENFKKNPEEYSAKLLLMTTENYLSDLIKQLDAELLRQKASQGPDTFQK